MKKVVWIAVGIFVLIAIIFLFINSNSKPSVAATTGESMAATATATADQTSAEGSPADIDQASCAKMHDLSGPFIVYRATVAQAMNLTKTQENLLLSAAPALLQQNLSTSDAQMGLMNLLTLILTPDQWGTFDHLNLQHESVPYLLDPIVASYIGITDAQKTEIQGVVQAMNTKIQALIQKTMASGNDTNAWIEGSQIYTDAEAQALQFMTPSQQTLWNSLLGQPFPKLFDAACI